jgi:3-hydroxyisobutyrate dehydrogenase-like beta-hydroxyacid dehydrogenase
LIGGDREAAARIAPVVDALFPRSFHVGCIGDGARTKLAINLILGLNRGALAEGLVFASRQAGEGERDNSIVIEQIRRRGRGAVQDA